MNNVQPTEYYIYALAFRQSSKLPFNTKIHDIPDLLDESQVFFDADGYYSFGQGTARGACHFCNAEELSELAVEFNWPLKSNCSFVGDTIGYCLLQPWDGETFSYLIECLLGLGCGFVARIDGSFCFDIVVQRELTLRQVVGRHGFNEGSFILMETDNYHQYIRNSIDKALRPLGLVPESYNAGDHEHILAGFEGDQKNRARNWEIFEANADEIKLNLWVADSLGIHKIEKIV